MILKKFVLPLIVVVALTIAGYFGIKSFNHANDSYTSLLIENIEALTAGDVGGYGSSVCADGFPFYGIVYSTTGQSEEVQHCSDGFNGSPGLDKVIIVDFIICHADGNGSLKGANYSMPTGYGAVEYRTCTGNHNHHNFSY